MIGVPHAKERGGSRLPAGIAEVTPGELVKMTGTKRSAQRDKEEGVGNWSHLEDEKRVGLAES